MSTEKIARSIAARIGAEDLLEKLVDLSASELAAVLLQLHRERSKKVSFPKLLEHYERTPMFHPATSDVRALRELDRLLFESAAAFDAVELSPISPFGLNAAAGIDQNNVLSALRAAEVLADPTAAKALELALRRRRDRSAVHRLCGTHRLLRMQPLPKGGAAAGYSQHFRIFTLVSAGRDTGDESFERAALYEHFAVYLGFFRRCAAAGYHFGEPRAFVSDTRLAGVEPDARARERLERVRATVLEPLQRAFPEVRAEFDHTRTHAMGYYSGYCIKVQVQDSSGADRPLVDGGFCTWTQSYLADKKERMFSSAIGTELVAKRFRVPPG